MNIVSIMFSRHGKVYFYTTKLNFIVGAKYKIVTNSQDNYDNKTVLCVGFSTNINKIGYPGYEVNVSTLKEIVSANCVNAPAPKVSYKIKNIYENFDKGITIVLWDDGDKTTIKCDENDVWDREKAIAIAYMKKHFGNRGCFNDEINKWTNILEKRWEKEFEKCV